MNIKNNKKLLIALLLLLGGGTLGAGIGVPLILRGSNDKKVEEEKTVVDEPEVETPEVETPEVETPEVINREFHYVDGLVNIEGKKMIFLSSDELKEYITDNWRSEGLIVESEVKVYTVDGTEFDTEAEALTHLFNNAVVENISVSDNPVFDENGIATTWTESNGVQLIYKTEDGGYTTIEDDAFESFIASETSHFISGQAGDATEYATIAEATDKINTDKVAHVAEVKPNSVTPVAGSTLSYGGANLEYFGERSFTSAPANTQTSFAPGNTFEKGGETYVYNAERTGEGKQESFASGDLFSQLDDGDVFNSHGYWVFFNKAANVAYFWPGNVNTANKASMLASTPSGTSSPISEPKSAVDHYFWDGEIHPLTGKKVWTIAIGGVGNVPTATVTFGEGWYNQNDADTLVDLSAETFYHKAGSSTEFTDDDQVGTISNPEGWYPDTAINGDTSDVSGSLETITFDLYPAAGNTATDGTGLLVEDATFAEGYVSEKWTNTDTASTMYDTIDEAKAASDVSGIKEQFKLIAKDGQEFVADSADAAKTDFLAVTTLVNKNVDESEATTGSDFDTVVEVAGLQTFVKLDGETTMIFETEDDARNYYKEQNKDSIVESVGSLLYTSDSNIFSTSDSTDNVDTLITTLVGEATTINEDVLDDSFATPPTITEEPEALY